MSWPHIVIALIAAFGVGLLIGRYVEHGPRDRDDGP